MQVLSQSLKAMKIRLDSFMRPPPRHWRWLGYIALMALEKGDRGQAESLFNRALGRTVGRATLT